MSRLSLGCKKQCKGKPGLEEVAYALAAWAINKREIEWIRLFGSRVKGWRYADDRPPLPNSDLDIAIKLDAEILQGHSDSEKHRWSDETNPVLAFTFDHKDDWNRELEKISPWPIDLNFCGPDTPHMFDYLENGSLLIYKRSRT